MSQSKPRFVVKRIYLRPEEISAGGLKATLYSVEEDEWSLVEVDEMGENMLNKMMEIAGNELARIRPRDHYAFVTVESPGLSVIIGEGLVEGSRTILSPKPSPLKSIKLIRVVGEEGKYEVVAEIKPEGEKYVYDGLIELPPDISYDLILVETSEDRRIIMPSELLLPAVKAETGGQKRRKRRRKSKERKKKKGTRGKKKKSSFKRRRR